MINRIYGGPADGLVWETPGFCQPPEFLYCLLVDFEGSVQMVDDMNIVHPKLRHVYSQYRLVEFVRNSHATFRFERRNDQQG